VKGDFAGDLTVRRPGPATTKAGPDEPERDRQTFTDTAGDSAASIGN